MFYLMKWKCTIMKPKIDLNNPFANHAIAVNNKMVLDALNAPQTVEKAVIPIYYLPELKKQAIQIASGVLVNIKNEYFIFSASHVFDQIGNHQLLTGDGLGNKVISLPGEIFSTLRDKSGTHSDDPLDASVYHIQTEIPSSLKKCAITLDDFIETNCHSNCVFLSSGFRIRKSNTAGYIIHSKREAFASREIEENHYSQLELNPQLSIALWHEEQVLIDGRWQFSPIPRGFSGGAIIKVVGIPNHYGIKYRQMLAGIIIEHRKKDKNMEGVIIGTRTCVHLAALKKYIPDIF